MSYTPLNSLNAFVAVARRRIAFVARTFRVRER